MADTCQRFLKWFQKHGGTIDLTSMGLTEFPASEGGRGAVALKDIEEGHILFSIPRDLTLSTRTSALPTLFGLENWQKFGLHEGWSGLILSMMWEAAQGPRSKWEEYMNILPTSFNTPMFWDEKELAELKGTSIVQKLGKEDAKKDYQSKLKPAIESRPDIFPPADHATHYSFHNYHIMGSRILSRSFNVEKWQGDADDEEHQGDKSTGSAMDVDDARADEAEARQNHHEEGEGHESEGDSDDDEEQTDSSDTAMVPMADMLNARYEHANASLFYEKDVLNMVATEPIKAGEQIWNTYNDLPNSELLRRYGHVDLLPLSNGDQGNPGDVVEMPATVVVDAVKETRPTVTDQDLAERIDWWLEEGGDDIFDFDWEVDYPESVFSLIRLLLLSDADWQKAQEKSKLPKSKPDAEALQVLQSAIQRRMIEYSTSIQDDEALMLKDNLALNFRNAVIVRLGEKKILAAMLAKVKIDIAAYSSKQTKRKSESQHEAKGSKKSKR